MTDDLEKLPDETEPEAEPGEVIEIADDGETVEDGEAGSADAEPSVEPEKQDQQTG